MLRLPQSKLQYPVVFTETLPVIVPLPIYKSPDVKSFPSVRAVVADNES